LLLIPFFEKTTFPWGRGSWEDKTIWGRCYNAFITSVTSLVGCSNTFELDCVNEALRKLSWVFEFWNEVLVSKNVENADVKKNLLKASSYGKVTRWLSKRGWKLMTCHLFLDNFSWNLWPLDFRKVRCSRQGFFSKRLFPWGRALFERF
jgi:hypothetical protein